MTATEGMIQAVTDRACKPGPRRDPKLPAELQGVERHDIATSVGPVAAWRVGEGPAALLVHGWQDSSRLWSPLMVELQARGKPFVVFDLPAHGFSPGDFCMQTEVVESVRSVAAALGPVDAVVAHSFAGGGTCICLDEGLAATRVALIAPPLHGGPARWRRIAGELGFDAEVGEEALDRYVATLPPSRGSFVMAEVLQRLPVELLLVASHDDERFPLELARELMGRVPHGELYELHGVNHRNSARDKQPVARIADFLDEGPRA